MTLGACASPPYLEGNSYMRYEAEIRAFDVMDSVWVRARIFKTEDIDPDAATECWVSSISVAGVGEPDHKEWLKDALVALIEHL